MNDFELPVLFASPRACGKRKRGGVEVMFCNATGMAAIKVAATAAATTA